MKTNYPHTVQEWLETLYSNLKKEGFFKDQELGLYSEERVYYHFQDILGVVALQSWLKDGEVKLTEKELTTLLFQVVVKTHIEELKNEGTVDYIEDENGDEVMWLTQKGKNQIKDL
tara:strand:- start:881 stop:1228 length:348 start_codon:yes stop_codon:yes gene_type:complete